MIFDKIKKYANVYMCYMVQKQMETLTVATMKLIQTRTSLEFLHACKMVELYIILNTLTQDLTVWRLTYRNKRINKVIW